MLILARAQRFMRGSIFHRIVVDAKALFLSSEFLGPTANGVVLPPDFRDEGVLLKMCWHALLEKARFCRLREYCVGRTQAPSQQKRRYSARTDAAGTENRRGTGRTTPFAADPIFLRENGLVPN